MYRQCFAWQKQLLTMDKIDAQVIVAGGCQFTTVNDVVTLSPQRRSGHGWAFERQMLAVSKMGKLLAVCEKDVCGDCCDKTIIIPY